MTSSSMLSSLHQMIVTTKTTIANPTTDPIAKTHLFDVRDHLLAAYHSLIAADLAVHDGAKIDAAFKLVRFPDNDVRAKRP